MLRALLAMVTFTLPLQAQWQAQDTNTVADFRGLSVVNKDIVWASGTKGTVIRTTNGGKTWKTITIKDAETLDFRAIRAFSDTIALAMSAGVGADSRIYKTTNGGETWQKQFTATNMAEFYDAIGFWDESHGIAFSDPVMGKFRVISTSAKNKTWEILPSDGMPVALEKEGAFAASGTCLVTLGEKQAMFVTGGAKVSRVFHTKNRGESWSVAELPIAAGVESAGAFSVGVKDESTIMVVGGDYKKDTQKGTNAALTTDGGKTWAKAGTVPFLSCVAWANNKWVAVGTAGTWETKDDGKTWTEVNTHKLNAVAFAKTGEGFAVGPKGAVYHCEVVGK